MLYNAAKLTVGFLSLFAALIDGEFSHVDLDDSQIKDAAVATPGSPFLSVESSQTIKSEYSSRPRRQVSVLEDSCYVLPQPLNGVGRRHSHYCGKTNPAHCEVNEGDELAPGTLLTYTCNPGYKLIGNPTVLCEGGRKWSKLPECVVIECSALNSTSLTARCFRLGRWVDCNAPVLQGTRAKLSCHPGYLEAEFSGAIQSRTIECNADGKWEPDPIACRPACGVAVNDTTRDFPWRASLYWRPQGYTATYFKCGATIIRNNLILTAASCVSDALRGDSKNHTNSPEDFFVMAGNRVQDYDHPLHDFKTVWNSSVKNIYVHCDYHGKDSAGDIALIETTRLFEFSSSRLPACLEDYSDAEEPIEPDAYGSVIEFGATTLGNRPTASSFLRMKTVPYLPNEKCNGSKKLVYSIEFTSDKFCSGYPDSFSPVCISDEGGGLMFRKRDLWYVIGVVTSVPFRQLYSQGNYGCENYAIETNVTQYTAWIQDVIFNLERYKSHPPCNFDGSLTNLTPKIDRPDLHEEDPSCTAPPQPDNGHWMFHRSLCANETECKILQGAPLRPGTQLIYQCTPGYKAIGSTEVYCGFNGNWSAIPICAQIRCESLNSVSRTASCYDRFNEWVSCDSDILPGTRAEVSCHLGYRMHTVFSTFSRETVRCGEDGRWTPDPIRCVPVCGVATTHQTPYIINGTVAKLSDFPWHSTLYLQRNSLSGMKKEFICGGTIIQTNFVLTAAHCVYDETTKTTTDPDKLFVMTGNIFRDYDSPLHNRASVRKTRVKNIYRPCEYYGVRGNYASDIALLEIETPFVFSNILSPVCLDVEDYGTQILEPGAEGRVAGFGRTAAGESSGILQTLTLPYIPYNQCIPKNKEKNDILFSKDKFCAGYTNGSAVCEGDSGGGLVFRKGEQWYVLGIVSLGLNVDLDNGERTCDKYAYSLYTKVSEHMTWIQDVMYQRARHHVYPPCENDV